tara:strand:+ start:1365 stop:1949 length:585 start_codon:yes stop_codon:yes gene_type:complete
MKVFLKNRQSNHPKPALFLDRDGVINKDYGYVHKIENFHFMEHIVDLIKAANKAEYLVVVVTNQAGIGRGFYSLEEFRKLTEWMLTVFKENGALIDGVYFSPFHPTEGLGMFLLEENSRKPNPGMFFEAKKHLHIDLENSLMVGDKASDMCAGLSASISNNFLLSENNQSELSVKLKGKIRLVSSLTQVIPHLK